MSRATLGREISRGFGRAAFRPFLERLLDALDALPIEQAGERPQPKRAKVLLRNIDDDFVTKTCATYLNEIDGADAEVRANRGVHGEINRLWSDLNGAPALKDLQSMLSVGPIGQTVHDLLAGFLSDHNYIAGRDIVRALSRHLDPGPTNR